MASAELSGSSTGIAGGCGSRGLIQGILPRCGASKKGCSSQTALKSSGASYCERLRSRTPGPPPFSSMNSTPAFLSTFSINARVAGSPAYRPTSIFVIVFRCRPVAAARSRTVQFRAARAILTCAIVTAMVLCNCHMCRSHTESVFGGYHGMGTKRVSVIAN